ncbi:hypothetical protein HDK64DRAFT_36890 [Phyllosticta capitalensis]
MFFLDGWRVCSTRTCFACLFRVEKGIYQTILSDDTPCPRCPALPCPALGVTHTAQPPPPSPPTPLPLPSIPPSFPQLGAALTYRKNSRVSSRPRPCTISQQGRAGWPRLPRPAAAPPPPTFLGTRSSDDAAVAENSTPRSAESQAERGSRIEAILAARALRAGRGAVAEERGGGEDRGAWSRGDGLGCCHDFERCVDEACWAGSGVLD